MDKIRRGIQWQIYCVDQLACVSLTVGRRWSLATATGRYTAAAC